MQTARNLPTSISSWGPCNSTRHPRGKPRYCSLGREREGDCFQRLYCCCRERGTELVALRQFGCQEHNNGNRTTAEIELRPEPLGASSNHITIFSWHDWSAFSTYHSSPTPQTAKLESNILRDVEQQLQWQSKILLTTRFLYADFCIGVSYFLFPQAFRPCSSTLQFRTSLAPTRSRIMTVFLSIPFPPYFSKSKVCSNTGLKPYRAYRGFPASDASR